MPPPRSWLKKCFLLCAVFFSLQIIPRWWSDSIITDEEWELTASYYYWKTGDVWTPGGTPGPGALCALPLLALDLKLDPSLPPKYTDRSVQFLYIENRNHLAAITALSRSVHWLLGLLIGFILYRLVQDVPLAEGIAALVLWAFEPSLLAYGGTAKSDMAVVFWFFLSIYYFSRIQSQGKNPAFALAGFLAGLTATTRYQGLFILPVLMVLEIFHWRDNEGSWKNLLERTKKGTALLAGFIAAISLVYLPGTLSRTGHPSPLTLYFHYLRVYADLQPEISNHLVYFAGRFWTNGSYLFFPYHFFFKNTLPLFFLMILGIMGGLLGKVSLPRWVWVPPAIYIVLFFFADKSMTIRHALPAYPFLILIAAKAFQWLWESCRSKSSALIRVLPVILLFWHPLSVLLNFPHTIAYANDFLTTGQKSNDLSISNWNLGQDMKRLAELGQKRGWKKVKLITPQRTDPYFYGLAWESWTHRDLAQPQSGTVYVVDYGILNDLTYNAYLTRESPWVAIRPPTGNIGGTLYYYEIPEDPAKTPKDDTQPIISFPYYPGGIPPYRSGL